MINSPEKRGGDKRSSLFWLNVTDEAKPILKSDARSSELTPEQKEKIETNILKREEILAPIYHQVPGL